VPSGVNCAELTWKVLDSRWLTTQLSSLHVSTHSYPKLHIFVMLARRIRFGSLS